ncbi:McrC family protein [Brevibacillus sp. AY1]|uniref:McrC family protein n=1 Tax=Brevibacillus sp. AY1 TaxID=2807621 RepID=UPI002453BD66|nr:McrC family protein [Brevibacillus sp. AY1]MDH4619422.1 McrC family protein [Brevibacillus sp. AY1]
MTQRFFMKEYDSFTRNVIVSSNHYHPLPESTFDQLEQFILSKKQDGAADALELMSISSKRGIGKIISAKNYVGLITLRDGTELEILPKVYTHDQESSADETKRVFLDMLKFLQEIPYKTFHFSHVKLENMNILEIFIRMFIEEVYTLVKRGLKLDYVPHQDNEHFLKGKWLFSQHIKSNIAHKERFFIEYDVFSINRTENRLIKTTLEALQRCSSSSKNKKDIRLLLAAFESVDVSVHPDHDFARVVSDSSMKEYATIIQWCSIFLRKQSFTSFSGNGLAYSLLFPMEKVFESYVAGKLSKALDKSIYRIKTQDRVHHLFDEPKRFLLKPDIVVQRGHSSIVLDTKWKRLSTEQSNYGISQSDMYQAYAYHQKYGAKTVFLLYPSTGSMGNTTEPFTYRSKDGVTVRIGFVDLIQIDHSIQQLVQQIHEIMLDTP